MTRAQWLTLALLWVSVLAAASPPRHVNPEEVIVGRPDPRTLTSAYNLLAELLSAESYENASQLVKLLLNVTASPDLAYALRRFHEELKGVSELLNLSRSYLEQARKLALAGRIEDSATLLGEVVRVLAKANLTRADLELAAREVQRRLGAQPAPLLTAVTELLAKHSDEAASLGALVGKRSTELTVEAVPRSAWVGSAVLVIGRLTSLGEPLGGRKIAIAVEGSIVGNVLTDEKGSFAYRLKLPYVYRRSLAVSALYLPEAEDAKVYRPSSNSTEVLLLYETPQLSVRVEPPEALPGDRVRIEVRADRPGLRVKVQALHVFHQLVLTGGVAKISLEIPVDAPEGVYRVVASSEPNGTLGPASVEATVMVRKLDLKLTVSAPPLIVALVPARFTVCVEGREETLPAYSVKLSIAGTVVEAESQQACTSLEAMTPPATPTGSTHAEVIVTPSDPRYRLARAEVQAFVVNPLLLVPAAGLLASLTLAMKPSSSRPELLPPPAEPPKASGEIYSLKLRSADPVVSEYLEGVRIVEKATGMPLKPSHTISEYLQLVEPKLGEAARPFATLSGLAEARLYGGFEMPPEAARLLREQLEKLLGGTT